MHNVIHKTSAVLLSLFSCVIFRAYQAVVMLHPDLAPLVLLGQIRQGTMIAVGRAGSLHRP
jgi:hypothetical protein